MATGDSYTYKISGHTHTGTIDTAVGCVSNPFDPLLPYTTGTPASFACVMGHSVDRWAEYLDGECVGYCTNCNARLATRRHPGGMPFMRLKALTEMLLASPGDPALLLEIQEVEALLAAEQRALDEARSLLEVTKQMARCTQD